MVNNRVSLSWKVKLFNLTRAQYTGPGAAAWDLEPLVGRLVSWKSFIQDMDGVFHTLSFDLNPKP